MKKWFITGASSGLGREFCQQLLQRGDSVVATLRKAGPLDDLHQRYGDRLQVLYMDVTDSEAVRAAVAQAFAGEARIDVVVSNAGYGLFGAAEELTDAQISRQLATNLTGSIQLIRAVLPFLRRQGGGRIVQISSEGGQIAYPNFSLYHASKWGIEGFIESVAQEVSAFGIDFMLAEPGPTGTQFAHGLDQAPPLAAYQATASGEMRRALASGAFTIKGDATRTVSTTIAFCDMAHPPLRLPLGSTAWHHIRDALHQRLEALIPLEQTAAGADADAE